MFWNKYPYTNFHELNLDWILNMIKDLEKTMSEWEALNKITFAGEWDITKQYPAWAIVNTNNGQEGYISIKPVPAGVTIDNTEYWVSVVNYTATIADLQNRVIALEGEVSDLNQFVDDNGEMIDVLEEYLSYNYGLGTSITAAEIADVIADGHNTIVFANGTYTFDGTQIPVGSELHIIGVNAKLVDFKPVVTNADFELSGCELSGGVVTINANTSNQIEIKGCSFEDGAFIDTTVSVSAIKNVLIEGNNFIGNSYGISGTYENSVIRNNYFSGITTIGIVLYHAANNLITGNKFTSCNECINFLGWSGTRYAVTGNVVSNNEFIDTTDEALLFDCHANNSQASTIINTTIAARLSNNRLQLTDPSAADHQSYGGTYLYMRDGTATNTLHRVIYQGSGFIQLTSIANINVGDACSVIVPFMQNEVVDNVFRNSDALYGKIAIHVYGDCFGNVISHNTIRNMLVIVNTIQNDEKTYPCDNNTVSDNTFSLGGLQFSTTEFGSALPFNGVGNIARHNSLADTAITTSNQTSFVNEDNITIS